MTPHSGSGPIRAVFPSAVKSSIPGGTVGVPRVSSMREGFGSVTTT